MKRVTLAALTAIFATGLVSISPARAAEAETEMKHVDWTFDGPFGHFDRAQLQRGFKVYQEVCSACHSMNLVAIRTLGQEGGPEFTEAEVKAIAATYTISKDIDENGDVIDRPGKPSDHFPAPFANENAARASNGGALPPDFSVLAKARHGNADYIYSIVTGYEEPPADMTMRTGMHYNTAFHGNQIAMAQPIDDGAVTYDDGTEETLDQYAQDVAAFLYWTAEPKLEARNRTGFKVILFLILFAGLLYFTKKKLWRDVEH
ncbi:MAG: cytochrome c1 [Rhodobiaceae bacterium]|nr:cytochrome c1 [Rhodobiaceae bacterium]